METDLEHLLINSHKDEMIAYMETHPEDFDEAIKLAILDKQPYSWRAAWLLWSCMDENDPRAKGYVKDIIEALPAKNADHQRELIKILHKMELNEDHEGELFGFCTTIWKKLDYKPSVRFNAFKLIAKIARKHPDLNNEITFFTQNRYLDTLSSAARKSISKMVKELNVV